MAWKRPSHGRSAESFEKNWESQRRPEWCFFWGGCLPKKADLLLRAFAEVKKRCEDMPLRLVFAGPDLGGVKAQLVEMAAQLDAGQEVQFAGPLFGQDKWAAYRDADVFVLPSQNENFGNTAAEAVASGTPVIVTEQCGIAPLLANQAGMVARHEAHNVAEALSRILTDEELRRHLAAGCAKVTRQLGWGEPVHQMERLYAGCISPQGTGRK